jgi:hypothetical protein
MASIDATLDRKAGPFTGRVWALIVMGGVVVGIGWRLYSRGREPVEPVIVDDLPDDLPGESVLSAQPFPSFASYPATPGGYGEGGVPLAPTPTTNVEWAQRAISELIARGYNPTAAQMAISRYISGEGLSVGDRALVDEAQRRIGAPPELVPPQSVETLPPAGPTTPAPTPPAGPTVPNPTTPDELAARLREQQLAAVGSLQMGEAAYLRYRYRCATTGDPNECLSARNVGARLQPNRRSILNKIPVDAIPNFITSV